MNDIANSQLAQRGNLIALNLFGLINQGQDQVKAATRLIGYFPLEELVYFRGPDKIVALKEINHRLHKLRILHIIVTGLPTVLPECNPSGEKDILSRLEDLILSLESFVPDDWSPLMSFLAAHDSSEKQLSTLRLKISRFVHMPPGVVEDIEKLVQNFDRILVP